MIDLHSHSTASDGILSPRESALYAFEKHLTTWALTDHDTVDGLKEAAKTCLECGINFIPGIEINIAWPTGEFHLLGLGLRTYSEDLKNVIDYLTQDRYQRNLTIVEKMNADGYNWTLEEIESNFVASQIGRPHFADFLVKKGIVKNRQDAFNRFFGRGKKWYSSHCGEDLETAVQAIKSSGGVPVLAHPMSLYVSWGKIEGVLKDIRSKGVEGLEAFHPGARNSECFRLEEMARKLGFFVTAGSDFHGKGVRADRHLGKTAGGRKIDKRFWEDELNPALGGDFDFKLTDWVK
ncbi:PHP domain-containing protein [Treponema pectinovorum]|uniref:PHP domain-containing protein n=1 Tax=Treponema pectinovorum TaxID=164 RepID=UPI0011C9D7AF|nr:PHP domain-containing protein [Treponema pectinovorum]